MRQCLVSVLIQPNPIVGSQSGTNFPFPLLVDTNGALAKAWGLPKTMLGLSPPRVTCVIDIEGIFRAKIQSMVPHLHAEKAPNVCVRSMVLWIEPPSHIRPAYPNLVLH